MTAHSLRNQFGNRALLWQVAFGSAAIVLAAWAVATLPLTQLILSALSLTGLFVLLRWPWLIWPTLALSIPITSGIRFGAATGTELVVAAAVGLWLIDGSRRGRLRIVQTPILLPVILYTSVLAISLLWAPSLGDGIAEVVKWIEFGLVLALLPAMVRRRQVIWLVAALVLAGVLQAVLGLYQFTYQVGPEWFVLYDRFMRASGSFRQPNPYAGYLGVLLPIAFSMALWTWFELFPAERRGLSLLWALYYSGGFMLISAGLLASWSRGGWLAAAVALAVVVAVRYRRGLLLVLSGILAATAVALLGLLSPIVLPASLADRLQGTFILFGGAAALDQPVNDENFALIERLAHWVTGFRMWESAPWAGIGVGNFATVYNQFNLPLWTEPLGHAHNLYINILAENGLIGLAAFGLLWVSLAVWTVRRRTYEHGQPFCGWCSAMAAGVLGSMAYVTVHSMVDMLFVQGIYLTLALVFAALAAGCSAVNDTEAISSKELSI